MFGVLGCAAILAFASCDSPLSPSQVAGTYVLMPAEGTTLPVVVIDDEWITVSVLADTIRLRGDRSGEHARTQIAELHAAEDPPSVSTWRTEFHYRIRRGRIEISYICPPNALCTPPPHEIGRFEGDGFVLESIPEGFVYRRVDP